MPLLKSSTSAMTLHLQNGIMCVRYQITRFLRSRQILILANLTLLREISICLTVGINSGKTTHNAWERQQTRCLASKPLQGLHLERKKDRLLKERHCTIIAEERLPHSLLKSIGTGLSQTLQKKSKAAQSSYQLLRLMRCSMSLTLSLPVRQIT